MLIIYNCIVHDKNEVSAISSLVVIKARYTGAGALELISAPRFAMNRLGAAALHPALA